MKNKAMNVLLTTSMILGSASALAGNYSDKSTSSYDEATKEVPTSRTHTKPMHDSERMDKTAAATDTWSHDRSELNTTASMENIKSAQKALNDKGFKVGPIDGVIGQKTRTAIMDFQRENDLAATGSLNKETMDAMDIAPNFKDEGSDTYAE